MSRFSWINSMSSGGGGARSCGPDGSDMIEATNMIEPREEAHAACGW